MTMSNDLTKKQTGTGLSTESGRFRQDLINQLTPEQRATLEAAVPILDRLGRG